MEEEKLQKFISFCSHNGYCHLILLNNKKIKLERLNNSNQNKVQNLNLTLNHGIKIHSIEAQILSEGFSFFQQIQKLNLITASFNDIGEGLIKLGENLKSLQFLNKLHLLIGQKNNNKIDNLNNFMQFLPQMVLLQDLKIQISKNNAIDSKFVAILNEQINQLKNLKRLSISLLRIVYQNNEIANAGISLSQNINLSEVNICLSLLEDKEASIQKLSQSLSTLTQLTHLKIEFRRFQISQQDLQVLHQSISNLKQLKFVKIFIKKTTMLQFISLLQSAPNINEGSIQINFIKQLYFKRGIMIEETNNNILNLIKNQLNSEVISQMENDFQQQTESNQMSLPQSIDRQNINNNSYLLNQTSLFNNNQLQSSQINETRQISFIKSMKLVIQLLLLDIQGSQALRNGIKEFKYLEQFDFTLQDINIGGNQMEIIAQGFQFLTSLKIFKLVIDPNSNITETGSEAIGNSIANLINLQELVISIGKWNKVNIRGAIGLGSGLKKLINLQNLEIEIGDKNNISGEGMRGLFDGIKELTQLESMKINLGGNNDIGEIGCQAIGIALQNMKRLNSLNLIIGQQNLFNAKCMQLISDGLSLLGDNLTCFIFQLGTSPDFNTQATIILGDCLKRLNQLKNLRIQIEVTELIPFLGGKRLYEGIKCLKKIEKIYLKFDKTNLLQFISLPQELPLLKEQQITIIPFKEILYKRQNILLEGNQITSQVSELNQDKNQNNGKDQILEIQNVQETRALTELSFILSKENVNAEGIQSLAEGLKRLIYLKKLRIHIKQNAIRADGIKYLSSAFKSLQNLKKFQLLISRLNNIGAQGADFLNSNFHFLENVTDFSFSIGMGNFIGAQGFKNIIQGINKIPKIQKLYLKINPINNIPRSDFKILVEEIPNWRNLIHIGLNIKFPDRAIYLQIVNLISLQLTKLPNLRVFQFLINFDNPQIYLQYIKRKLLRLVVANELIKNML